MRNNRMKLISLLLVLFMVGFVGVVPVKASPVVTSRTYTLDADFDEGTLIGVEHETVHDQLQLSKEHVTLPFIWVPNQEGTVSKVQTETGKELGRYRVAPFSECSPSRTTVDLDGSCWVGNRQAGTVVKIGLYEIGQWMDRNEDGICQTSQDLNDDGDITGAEILPWGADECVLFEVVLTPAYLGTYDPGTFDGEYDLDYWGVSPRGLAIDADNNLWAGTWIDSMYYYIDGPTGTILKTVDVSPWNHHAYGAVIDANGILWSSGNNKNHLLRLDPSTNPPTISTLSLGQFSYGLGVDYQNQLFVSGWTNSRLARVDVSAGTLDWTKYNWRISQGRGVACTGDNHVWVASTYRDNVYRFDNDGNLKATIGVGDGPTGVAVDAAGKVWAVSVNDESIVRIDPVTNIVDLTKQIVGSGGHYGYSDMTGIVARTITTQIGTWTVTFDSEGEDTPWGKVSWSSEEPEGTSVTVKVRSSNDEIIWSALEDAENGVSLESIPDGRYLEIQTTFELESGDVSPILFDLTAEVGYIPVSVDIKPGSWPNPLNRKSKGVLPVAICGTPEFDVSTIDPASIRLTIGGIEDGVAPLRWSYEDVATLFVGDPFCGHDLNGDGIMDLTLKFSTQELVILLGLDVFEKGPIIIILTGNLKEEFGGTPILGQDYMIIVK